MRDEKAVKMGKRRREMMIVMIKKEVRVQTQSILVDSILCIKRRTARSTQHSSHGTQHTHHITHHTSHSTQHTAHSTQHTSHITHHTAHSTQHTTHSTHITQLTLIQISEPTRQEEI